MELLAKVNDHTTGKFVRGFRMLTLGWSDGNTLVPLCFSLLSSHKKSNRYAEMKDVGKRSVGYCRRKESVKKSPEILLDLLKQALETGVNASYVLFDSWFSFSSTIIKVREQGMQVICMLKALPKVYYGYNGQRLNLNALHKYQGFVRYFGVRKLSKNII
ncbi:transposase [Desulfoscipio geothermicus]|nr:transposase [Desulfoscipio geothermicus]